MSHYENIGKSIRKKRLVIGIKVKDVDMEMAEIFGIEPITARNFRQSVESGFIYGTSSFYSIYSRGQKLLNRLSVYLETLGFDTFDPVIDEIRSIDDRFVYPLPDSPELSFELQKVKK